MCTYPQDRNESERRGKEGYQQEMHGISRINLEQIQRSKMNCRSTKNYTVTLMLFTCWWWWMDWSERGHTKYWTDKTCVQRDHWNGSHCLQRSSIAPCWFGALKPENFLLLWVKWFKGQWILLSSSTSNPTNENQAWLVEQSANLQKSSFSCTELWARGALCRIARISLVEKPIHLSPAIMTFLSGFVARHKLAS